jgi:glycerol uptake facilitator-like aquaporin
MSQSDPKVPASTTSNADKPLKPKPEMLDQDHWHICEPSWKFPPTFKSTSDELDVWVSQVHDVWVEIRMAYVAEFLGTFFFLLVILTKGEAFAIAIGLYAAISAFGCLSGGHFNPTVSIIFLAKNDFKSTPAFLGYLIAQILGAVAALSFFNYTQPLAD